MNEPQLIVAGVFACLSLACIGLGCSMVWRALADTVDHRGE